MWLPFPIIIVRDKNRKEHTLLLIVRYDLFHLYKDDVTFVGILNVLKNFQPSFAFLHLQTLQQAPIFKSVVIAVGANAFEQMVVIVNMLLALSNLHHYGKLAVKFSQLGIMRHGDQINL